MIRSELVGRVGQRIAQKHPHLNSGDAEKIVKAILEEIAAKLEEGCRIELRGFGVFLTRERKPRTSRNPSTGKVIAIACKRAVLFKYSKEMHRRLNKQ